jgi:hypothetical protein
MSCHVKRVCDINRFNGKSLELTPAVLELAWVGFFGREAPVDDGEVRRD